MCTVLLGAYFPMSIQKKILTVLTQKRIATLVFIVIGIGILALFFIYGGKGTQTYPEALNLSPEAPKSFQEYSDYFRKLAQDKGAPYAFEVLKRASFPPGVDIHLLAHVVGDVLYQQQGVEGIKVCTPDFRNACSHSVVIGMLTDHGENALPDIAQACKAAPGGRGAYTMCFHGLGHGVLAFNGYNFEKAVAMCKKTGTPEYANREYSECVGGATMEMVAGVHDRQAWEKQKDTYLVPGNALSPCNLPFMSEEVRPICYTYLTPRLFEAAGADLRSPDPSFYAKAFSFCGALPASDVADRNACYGGFGKEFIVLSQARDIRDIGSQREEDVKKVHEWCALADNEDGQHACALSALSSLFWGGENNPDASFLFCANAPQSFKDMCYGELAGQIRFYAMNASQRSALCTRLPEAFQDVCMRP